MVFPMSRTKVDTRYKCMELVRNITIQPTMTHFLIKFYYRKIFIIIKILFSSFDLQIISFNKMKWVLTCTVFVLGILTVLCQEHLVSRTCECGTTLPSNRIVNGRETKPHQYPWTVAIFLKGRINCGGSIINSRYILTAGHCVKWSPMKLITVHTGLHNLKKISKTNTYNATQFILHNKFYSHKLYDDNDIALIKVDRTIIFNEHVIPVCLPARGNLYANEMATVAGWGRLGEELNTSDTLQETVVKVMSDKDCLKTDMKVVVGPTVMCAYTNNTDSCQGDSGGPFIFESEPGKYEQIGVVSWGYGCSSPYPAIYTRVTYYVDWIYENTKDAIYCRA